MLGFGKSLRCCIGRTDRLEHPTHIIIGHRRNSLLFDSDAKHLQAFRIETSSLIVECQFIIVVAHAVHLLLQLGEMLRIFRQEIEFEETTIIEEVYLQRFLAPGDGFLFFASESKNGSLQGTSLVIVGVTNQTIINFLLGILQAMLHHGNLGTLEETCILPSSVPSRFIEHIVCLIHLVLILQGKAEVIDRFAIVWVRVALHQHLDRLAKILFRLGESTFADVPQSKGIVASVVHWVAAKRLLIVIHRIVSGMAILLQVKTCQIELVVGLDLLWKESRLGRIWYRTNLVWVGVPSHQQLAFQGFNLENKVFDAALSYLHGFVEHGLWVDIDHLIIIDSILVVA